MLKRAYGRLIALAGHPQATWFLAAVAFAEASFFPVPPDALLVAMGLARPRRVWFYALICTIGSVAGGALGYYIGYAVFDRLALPLIHFYHMEHAFQTFQQKFARYGVDLILIKGLTPIPYKLVTIAAGAARFDFWTFLRVFGEAARHFIERWLTLVTSLLAVGIVGGFLIIVFL
jgi:membrane protein YqaA with SNARE-associated domain